MFSNHDKLELCDEAVNGQDAVDKARTCAPDLVVLDLSMPVMNGLEAAKINRRFLPTVPIILFTMHASLFETLHDTPPAITRVDLPVTGSASKRLLRTRKSGGAIRVSVTSADSVKMPVWAET